MTTVTAMAQRTTVKMPMTSFCFHSIRTTESGENFGVRGLVLMSSTNCWNALEGPNQNPFIFRGDTATQEGRLEKNPKTWDLREMLQRTGKKPKKTKTVPGRWPGTVKDLQEGEIR